MIKDDVERWLLGQVGDLLRATLRPKGRGFALFLFERNEASHGYDAQYISDATRFDVVRALAQWVLVVTKDSVPQSADGPLFPLPEDLSHEIDRETGELAEQLEELDTYILFTFDFGDRGKLAWKSNEPKAVELVSNWVIRVSKDLEFGATASERLN